MECATLVHFLTSGFPSTCSSLPFAEDVIAHGHGQGPASAMPHRLAEQQDSIDLFWSRAAFSTLTSLCCSELLNEKEVSAYLVCATMFCSLGYSSLDCILINFSRPSLKMLNARKCAF